MKTIFKSTAGCFFASVIIGALASADDVISAPTAHAICCMLPACEQHASEFDMQFNVDKSKCIFLLAIEGLLIAI
jgi:hypothetical protein